MWQNVWTRAPYVIIIVSSCLPSSLTLQIILVTLLTPEYVLERISVTLLGGCVPRDKLCLCGSPLFSEFVESIFIWLVQATTAETFIPNSCGSFVVTPLPGLSLPPSQSPLLLGNFTDRIRSILRDVITCGMPRVILHMSL